MGKYFQLADPSKSLPATHQRLDRLGSGVHLVGPRVSQRSARCLWGLGRQRHYPHETPRTHDGSSDRSFST